MAGKSVSATREQLQLLVGDGLSIGLEGFINRAGTQYRKAVIAARPKTVNDVQLLLRSCLSLHLRVRAVANAFSLGPLFPEENQVVLYTDQLERHDGPKIELLKNDRDPALSELTVMCNVTNEELIEYQLANGIELPGNVIHRFSTVGGSVASMGHGVGLHVQTLSDLVVRMRIIDSSGNLRVYDLTDPELLDAAKGSLGLFGVIYDVTFRVAPLSVVQVENRWIVARHVFYERNFLSGLVHNNVSCQFFWWPLSSLSGPQRVKALFKKHVDESQWVPEQDEVWVRTINRPAIVPEEIPEEGLVFGTFWHGWSFKKKKWFSEKMPATTPLSIHKQQAAMKAQYTGRVIQPVPYAVHFLMDVDENPSWQMEFVFNHDKDCVNLQAAIMEMIQLLKAWSEMGNYPVNLPVEIGVTGASSAFLAPAYAGHTDCGGSGNAAYIKLASFVGTEGWREFCSGLVQRWLQIPGIRPNWEHQWSFLPDINNIISKNSEVGIAKFRSVHERAAVDPSRLFFTARLEEIILGTPTPISVPEPNPGLVYPSANNQQVHDQVAGDQNLQIIQTTPNGYIVQGQGTGLLNNHQILSTPDEHQQKKRRSKFKDLFTRHKQDDGQIVSRDEVEAYKYQHAMMVSGQPKQVMLLNSQNGKVMQGIPQQVVSQQGVPQQVITQQGVPQQVMTQQGVPHQVITQQGIPQQKVIMLQAPAANQNQVSYIQAGGQVVNGAGPQKGTKVTSYKFR